MRVFAEVIVPGWWPALRGWLEPPPVDPVPVAGATRAPPGRCGASLRRNGTASRRQPARR